MECKKDHDWEKKKECPLPKKSKKTIYKCKKCGVIRMLMG